MEIEEWLRKTEYDIESYVVIDDCMYDIWELHRGHMVKTAYEHGIKEGAVHMAIKILQGKSELDEDTM